jgi:hypothetical protein
MSDEESEEELSTHGVDPEDVSSDVLSNDEIGGIIVDSLEVAEPPERDVEKLTKILKGAQPGDTVSLTLGTDAVTVEREGEVENTLGSHDTQAPHLDWTYGLEVVIQPSEEDPTRLYRLGIGDSEEEPWYVASYLFEPAINMVDESSEIIHGWVQSAEVNHTD